MTATTTVTAGFRTIVVKERCECGKEHEHHEECAACGEWFEGHKWACCCRCAKCGERRMECECEGGETTVKIIPWR